MIIPFDKLKEYDFSATDIHVIIQKPTYRTLDVKSRFYNGFIYVNKGEGCWYWQDGECAFSKGTLVYLPLGSEHILKIFSDEIEFYRVDFQICIHGEIALFSKHPFKITEHLSSEAFDFLNALYMGIDAQNNSVYKKEKLCGLFRTLQANPANSMTKKLMPAVVYINEHFTEAINCHTLASLCYLSTSHFYALFKTEYGVTPLEYKNKIIINHAKNMLQYGDISVKEIASVLGFLSDGYFCRFFKKNTGMTPKEYKNKLFG